MAFFWRLLRWSFEIYVQYFENHSQCTSYDSIYDMILMLLLLTPIVWLITLAHQHMHSAHIKYIHKKTNVRPSTAKDTQKHTNKKQKEEEEKEKKWEKQEK